MAESDIESALVVRRLKNDLSPSDYLNNFQRSSGQLRYLWNGHDVPSDLKTSFAVNWTPEYLYTCFECNYTVLNVNSAPQTTEKTIGLWDCDVVEIFIAPNPGDPNRYLEIEVSPLGEWVDVELHIEKRQRSSNWQWHSNVEAACAIDNANKIWRTAFRIPSENLFGASINEGQECLGNFYRCDGTEPARNYITWRPTMTPEPNFHVPERFGKFRFVDDFGD
ncbi:MAG TPA: carbohydrate-binding family 9-like protein [Blastocatellia bacterium]|nr:carbohydrate-binding family 9-like protein [Blastocatellia bacterium]